MKYGACTDCTHIGGREQRKFPAAIGNRFTARKCCNWQVLILSSESGARNQLSSIGEITYLLGYSEPGSFTRAFRRWTGKSPLQFRGHKLAPQSIFQRT